MTLDVAAVRAAVADQVCAAVEALNPYTSLHSITLPALIVGRPELDRHVTFSTGGLSKVRVDCWVVAQGHDDETFNAELDEWTVSVVDALEADRTLGGVVTTLQIPAGAVQPGQMQVQGVALPAVQFTVDVWGTK